MSYNKKFSRMCNQVVINSLYSLKSKNKLFKIIPKYTFKNSQNSNLKFKNKTYKL